MLKRTRTEFEHVMFSPSSIKIGSLSINDDKENEAQEELQIRKKPKINPTSFSMLAKKIPLQPITIPRIQELQSDESCDLGSLSPGTICSPFTFHKLCLPTVPFPAHADCNMISSETLHKLLLGHYSNVVTKYYILDCRFKFEYDGGHINGALNLTDPFQAEQLFFSKPMQNVVIILHCEFSQHRAPKMYRFLREMDRKANADNYPALFYPEMYVLEGGYKDYFTHNSSLCVPCQYISMHDERFVVENQESFKKYKQAWKLQKQRSNPRTRRCLSAV